MASFSVSRSVLAKMLDAVLPSSPGDACFKLEVSADCCSLTYTDLRKSVQSSTSELSATGEVSVLVPAAKLAGAVRKADPGDVQFFQNGRRLDISSGRALWSLRLPSTPSSDFVEIPLEGAARTTLGREDMLTAVRTVRTGPGFSRRYYPTARTWTSRPTRCPSS